ncbi:hypothetical protein CY35_09G024800 [Sphagnum magellanicum]|nr:hypothetical protein CY35_09G024800 [Sphagnum magellanicum]KAH9551645.1 hypothetical protein CY35_09G024800 [Sphagnum magellanicum]KAH9551646.1 hypothetical protein CY35_09G024800 [Sphagnum magellanicum]KAH9551647.1 hypothetical protein CY35_09G024800 [Sphagnum magellanicum]KAH9551648.1 hypothetical protein CY35_09G024800 [Sphagnum magellanicum]
MVARERRFNLELEQKSNMYFPFRHDVNAKESMLNSSASMVLDSGSSVRPFASSSFSAQSGTQPFVHHGAGTLQGLHNLQANYSMQSVQNALSSRNQGMAGGPSTGTHQPAGGRYSSNSLPVGLPQQLSHVGLHGHTPMTSRSGISVVGNHAFSSSSNGGGGSGPGGSLGAPTVGNRGSFSGLGASGPRIASSVGGIGGGGGSLVGGGGLTRALNAGVGLDVQNLNGSRVNMGPLTSGSGMGGQGPGRSATSILQQGVNMASSTYNPSNDLLAMISRGSPKGISLLGSNFSTSPGSGIQGQVPSGNGQLGSIGLTSDGGANDGLAFDISEFPQLGTRQSSSGGLQGPVGSLRKQGVPVNAIVQQNQEFTIQNEDFPALPGFRGGNSEMTTESQHHKEQQHETVLSATVQSQHFSAVGQPGGGETQVHRSGGGSPGLGSYDQLVHHYQQTQLRHGGANHPQQQLAQQQSARDLAKVEQQGASEQFGLLGLLSVIRMSDPDLTTLALGTDLTTLGLNLNSRENLYKTFASPWAEGPTRGDPEFTVPQCYVQQAPRLQPGYFSKFQQDTLFYIFYSMPNDEAQLYAADELCNRGWFFHREHKLWLFRVHNVEPFVKADSFERGSYYFFDHNTWETGRKDNFVLQFEMIEKRPQLPSQQH